MPAAAAHLLPGAAEAESPESTGTHPTEEPVQPNADVVPLRPVEAAPAGASPAGRSPAPPASDAAPPGTAPQPPASDPAAARSGVRPTAPAHTEEAAPPPRPPVLASESLREDIEPTEPWQSALRLTGSALAGVGAIAAVALGGLHAGTSMVALLLLASGAACLLPIPYAWRAWSVLAASATALGLATAMRYLAGAPAEAPVLAPATVILAAGLLFRSAYRASQLARTVVAVGMLAIAIALVLADAVGEFAQVGTSWQSWLHVGTAVGFGVLLLVSLLAFMAPSTTGGTMLWGTCLLVWYAVSVGVTTLRHAYPEGGGAAAIRLPDPMAGLSVAAAAATALAALALAQALAAFVGGTAEQRRRQSRSGSSAPSGR